MFFIRPDRYVLDKLGAVIGIFHPAAAQRLIQMDGRLAVGQRDLHQLVLRAEQLLLRLQHVQTVGRALARKTCFLLATRRSTG